VPRRRAAPPRHRPGRVSAVHDLDAHARALIEANLYMTLGTPMQRADHGSRLCTLRRPTTPSSTGSPPATLPTRATSRSVPR
jgi:hypothetical protein